jgi:hypothetical protein
MKCSPRQPRPCCLEKHPHAHLSDKLAQASTYRCFQLKPLLSEIGLNSLVNRHDASDGPNARVPLRLTTRYLLDWDLRLV